MDVISKFCRFFFIFSPAINNQFLKKCFQLMIFYGGTTCKKKLRLVMGIIQKYLPAWLETLLVHAVL